MAEYSWPKPGEASVLGTPLSRLDGPVKVTGAAKYSSDWSLPGLLHGRLLTCPHAHARITKLDVGKAQAIPGVRAVRVIQGVGSEIQWAHDEIVAVAALTEEIAGDAVRAIEVEYEVLPHFVDEQELARAPETNPAQEEESGDPDQAFEVAEVVVENTLGMPQIAHLCLEPHGQVAVWQGEGEQQTCTVYASTQAVSTLPFQFAEPLGVPASRVRVRTDYMGGGFGSKFSPDRWGIEGAELARDAGAPVKLFLERDQEVAVAGSRPSAFARIKVGAQRDGRITAWQSESWGSGGRPGTGAFPIPYVFSEIPNRRKKHTSVPTHFAGSRAWRAPNHPQACYLTMAMFDDLAHELGIDPVELLKRNLDLTFDGGRMAEVYLEQLDLADGLMGWSQRYRPRGKRIEGSLQLGMGVSLHTWGGRGHQSNCEVKISPDGAVEARIGTQDLGTGTRTVVAMVLAETCGLEPHQVRVVMGDSQLPQSGPSGGSTTVGGVSGSTRRAAQDAVELLLEKVAPELRVDASELAVSGGRVFVRAEPSRGLSWSQAARLLGGAPISTNGRNPGRGQLNDNGVGGVQMAEVAVDVETGVVRIEKLVAVQDCGLVINRKLAQSQIEGGLIMGVGYSLYEERIADPLTGRLLNADMEHYRLAAIGDIGELVVHLMMDDKNQQRGVIGLGEPPVISPGAAISNAVANAIGVRVPKLPLTPGRVLKALGGG